MASYLVRVELPDRPGALGAVASRIGAVRGDVVAVDVVERRNDRAVDEFIVTLADDANVPLLLSEVAEVDGVTVEDVHPISAAPSDRRAESYDTAAALMQERTPHGVLRALAARTVADLDAAWAAVVDCEDDVLVATAGRPPAAAWLSSHVGEARHRRDPGPEVEASEHAGIDAGGARRSSDEAEHAPGDSASSSRPAAPSGGARRSGESLSRPSLVVGDVEWVDLTAWDLVLAAGRPGWRFALRDRLRLTALARLADVRWVDLAERDARLSHPSRAS